MPRETICVYCEKPLLDVEHAKKHVLEQCEKAPWRARLAELEQTKTFLTEERDQWRDLAGRNGDLSAQWHGKWDDAVRENTLLVARVAALDKQLSKWRENEKRIARTERRMDPSTHCYCGEVSIGPPLASWVVDGHGPWVCEHPQETETPAWGPSPEQVCDLSNCERLALSGSTRCGLHPASGPAMGKSEPFRQQPCDRNGEGRDGCGRPTCGRCYPQGPAR